MFTCRHFRAIKPTRATPQSAGHDLHATEDGVIEAGKRMLIGTGISWSKEYINHLTGAYGLIKERSSHANKYGITALAGVIDTDYKGEIKVILLNTGDKPFHFQTGDKIAQMIIMPYINAVNEQIDSEERTGGFGSTDKTH